MTLLRCYATIHPDGVCSEEKSKLLKPQTRLRVCIVSALLLCEDASQVGNVQNQWQTLKSTDKAESLH